MVELFFEFPPKSNPAELLFGETLAPPLAEATLSGTIPLPTLSAQVEAAPTVELAGTLPGLTLAAVVAERYEASLAATLPAPTLIAVVDKPELITLAGTLPALTLTAGATYSSNTDRPVVGQVNAQHQIAVHGELGVTHPHQSNDSLPIGWQTIAQAADDVRSGVVARHAASLRLDNPPMRSGYQEGREVGRWPETNRWTDAIRSRQSSRSGFQEAADTRNERRAAFQDMRRGLRPSRRSYWQAAVPSRTTHYGKFTRGLRTLPSWFARFQAARPPNGNNYYPPPVEPPFDPCYLPDPHLVFSAGYDSDTQLVFICERHPDTPTQTTVVVPIRSVYVVINNVSLRRVAGNITLPTLDMSLSIDADSWTWGFNASLPASTLDDLQPGGSGPVELEASINGNLYRVLVEQISRDRSFGSSSIKISGRGKTALLSSPYAPVLTFANSQQRTAQQLMADVLTFNNVPLAWTIDWQLTDWTVPAGAFNVTGTYIEGLTSIAGAAGAYLQPHPTSQEISVLLKYPVAPWDWAAEVTPDFELPSSVTVQEGIEWLEKPDYNRVYVSGTSAGVLGQVTRTGSGGTLAAPMVADALITHVDAARQRGLSILGDTGKQARVRLRLPVLPATGVITPGNFVRYVDGAETRLGLVRSTSVDAGWPEVWQSIELETHL